MATCVVTALFVGACLAMSGCAGTSGAHADEGGPGVLGADAPRVSPGVPGDPLHAGGVIGSSVEGRAIVHRVIGDGPARALLIGLIHGDEGEAFTHLEEVLARVRTDGVALHVVANMNPDGSHRSSRTNANGVDLNRNWPASNFRASARTGAHPLSEPEAAAVHALIGAIEPDLILVLHSARSGPFVDPDGPAGAYARVFARAASIVDQRWRVVPEFTNPPGSLGTYIGLDGGRPILTVEFERGQSPESARAALEAGLNATLRYLALRARDRAQR